MEMTKKIVNILDDLQNTYLRMIYSCPPTTLLPTLRTSAGMLDMETRVWMEKVCLTTRILHTREEEENHCTIVIGVHPP